MGKIFMALMLLAGTAVHGQDLPGANLLTSDRDSHSDKDKDIPNPPMPMETKVAFAVFGGEVLADGVATRILYQRHYDEIDPLAKPFTHAGVPGQVGASILAVGAIGGTWWALNRTHHERIARNFLRTVTAGEGANVGRQFSILRTSKK
jgi:hypothetical protein